MAAFQQAVTLGADAVELDVHLTADGHLVVHHDPVVRDGRRVGTIRSLTLADLSAFRVDGEPIPSLANVASGVGGRLRIYCELKGADTARASVAALAPLGDGAAVHSFDHRMVAEARVAAPAVPRGVLEASYLLDPVSVVRGVAGRDLWQQEALIDAPLVACIHGAGLRIIAWTVNDPTRARHLAALGVDGLCTDDVTGIRSALTAAPPRRVGARHN